MPLRVAAKARSRVYAAATRSARGRGVGADGLRLHRAPHDDGAFVVDPDGSTLAAVCRTPR